MGQEGGEVINQETTGPTATGTASSFVSVEFEVYGQVQGILNLIKCPSNDLI